MQYALRVTTPPTAEPMSLAEAREHLRVDHYEDDGVITGCVLAARQHIENTTGLALVATTFTMTLDEFPGLQIELPREPVQSVSAVRYTNDAGVVTTWSSSEYEVDLYSMPPRLRPRDGYSWPSPKDVLGAVQIEFVAGYGGVQAVPQPIMQAMRLLVGHFYENREASVVGTSAVALPFAVDALLAPYRTCWV